MSKVETKLVADYKKQPVVTRFEKLPRRIFLDTNVVQYINDFGRFIFENELSGNHFVDSKGNKIVPGEFLFDQIDALQDIFPNADRLPMEFAISKNVYVELQNKGIVV